MRTRRWWQRGRREVLWRHSYSSLQPLVCPKIAALGFQDYCETRRGGMGTEHNATKLSVLRLSWFSWMDIRRIAPRLYLISTVVKKFTLPNFPCFLISYGCENVQRPFLNHFNKHPIITNIWRTFPIYLFILKCNNAFQVDWSSLKKCWTT